MEGSAVMSGIFISYRREDTRGDAGRLAGDLKQRLGNNQVFRDIDTIEPGSAAGHQPHLSAAAIGAECQFALACLNFRFVW
jgi:hypothetical protein